MECLLHYYGVHDAARIKELAGRADAARRKGPWENFVAGYEREVLDYVGYEYGASSIRESSSLMIPWLLQTPGYTAAVMEAIGAPAQTASLAAAFHRERQTRVASRAPEQVYVLDECVLAAPARDELPAQLRRLAEIAGDPAVTIQVIPSGRGVHFGKQGPFTLLEVPVLGPVLYGDRAPVRRGPRGPCARG